ncbi:MAG: hypothetical protein ACE5JH_11000 [Acidobacteriota bacterium]
MSEILDDLLDTIERAISVLRGRSEARFGGDVENLLRIRRLLESLDPEEVEALLEADEEE